MAETEIRRKAEDLGEESAPRIVATLDAISLPDLIQTLSGGRKSAVVVVTHNGMRSRLWLMHGEVVDAESGLLTGEPAVYRLFSLQYGELVTELLETPRARTISTPLRKLLLQAAVRQDEYANLYQKLVSYNQMHPESSHYPEPMRGMTEVEADVLQTVDSPSTIDAVVARSRHGEVETIAALVRLREQGYLRPAGSAQHLARAKVPEASEVSSVRAIGAAPTGLRHSYAQTIAPAPSTYIEPETNTAQQAAMASHPTIPPRTYSAQPTPRMSVQLPPGTSPTNADPAPTQRRPSVTAAIGAASALIVAGLGAWLMWPQSTPPPTAPAASAAVRHAGTTATTVAPSAAHEAPRADAQPPAPDRTPNESAPAVSGPVTGTQSAASAIDPARARRLLHTLEVDPPDAQLRLNGSWIGTGRATVEITDETQVLRISAPGYQTQTVRLSRARPLPSESFTLRPQSRGTSASASARSSEIQAQEAAPSQPVGERPLPSRPAATLDIEVIEPVQPEVEALD